MMHMTPKEYQKKSPHLQTQYVLHQPDIMQLNQFQTFWETGYDVEMLKMCIKKDSAKTLSYMVPRHILFYAIGVIPSSV